MTRTEQYQARLQERLERQEEDFYWNRNRAQLALLSMRLFELRTGISPWATEPSLR